MNPEKIDWKSYCAITGAFSECKKWLPPVDIVFHQDGRFFIEWQKSFIELISKDAGISQVKFWVHITKHLKKKGPALVFPSFLGPDYPLSFFARSRKLVWMFSYIPGEKYFLFSEETVANIFQELGVLHRAGEGFFPPENVFGKADWENIENDVQEVRKNLETYQNLAVHHLHRTSFDFFYLSIVPELKSMVTEAGNILQKTDWRMLVKEAKSRGSLCLCDVNAWVQSPCGVKIGRIINFRRHAPVTDVVLMVKEIWQRTYLNMPVLELLAKHYGRDLNRDELKFLYAKLIFPDKVYHLIEKYYKNKRSSGEKNLWSRLNNLWEKQVHIADELRRIV